jgi:hypothetical protein
MKPNQFSNGTMLLAGLAISLCSGQVAHAQYTLQGNYLEVGVGPDGSIINPDDNSAPDNYNQSGFGQGYYQHPGIIWNGAGTGFSGAYANNDFITPGTPFQMYSIGVNGSYGTASFYGGNSLGASTVRTGPLSTLTTGTYGGLSYSQTLSYTANSSIIHFSMTLANNTGSTINNVAFATGLDPDPDVYEFEGTAAAASTDVYNTINTIVSPGVVQATGPLSGNSIIIQSLSGSANASILEDWPAYNPYALASNGQEDDGSPADFGIFDGWLVGNLAPGASDTINYNYIINATPVTSTSPVLTGGVPDMGSTWAMMGLALAGLGYGKRFVAGKRS